MKVPRGMTEETVVSIIYRVARKIAPRYTFGYHEESDIVQTGVQHAVNLLNRQKFKPKGVTNLERQLYAFLSICINNKLFNYRRDHSCRYDGNPDSPSNKSKYAIMHPLHIEDNIFADSSVNYQDDIDNKDYLATLREKLPTSLHVYLDKFLSGKKIPDEKYQAIITFSQGITCEETSES